MNAGRTFVGRAGVDISRVRARDVETSSRAYGSGGCFEVTCWWSDDFDASGHRTVRGSLTRKGGRHGHPGRAPG